MLLLVSPLGQTLPESPKLQILIWFGSQGQGTGVAAVEMPWNPEERISPTHMPQTFPELSIQGWVEVIPERKSGKARVVRE